MKVIKWIAGAIIWAGFAFLIGTAGSSDIDAICIDMAIVRSAIAILMVIVGFIAIYIIEKKENEK